MYRILVLALFFMWGCSGEDDPQITPPTNNQNNTNNQPDMSPDMQAPDTGPDMELEPCDSCSSGQVCFEDACCTPIGPDACGEGQCGMTDDGCGGMVDCGVCSCDFCPSRPCEVVTSCENQECTYAPLECGGLVCDCPDGDCDDVSLRDCREAGALSCPAHHCDPSPSTGNDGTVTYANVCAEPPGAVCEFGNPCVPGECNGSNCQENPCGLCNLGRWDCAEGTQTPTCFDIPETSISAADTNCNDADPGSTFIYVDHVVGTDAAGSGSKAQPYQSFAAAVAAAIARDAKGVVVRDGLVLNELLEVENGISIYGGYTGVPDWKPTENGQLVISNSSTQAGGHIIAVRAQDITERTVLSRVNINSANATTSGASSYGVHATNAPGLVIQDSVVVAGNGGPGTNGINGMSGAPGSVGQPGRASVVNAPSVNGGAAGTNPSCPIANGGAGGRGGFVSESGTPGTISASGFSGGAGGVSGSPGSPGQSPAAVIVPGTDGDGGLANYEVQNGLWINDGVGTSGLAGSPGHGGGGGGGGGGAQAPSPSGGFLNYNGGGGGGGGGGGCGGLGGSAGLAGGGSFGIFAIDSTGLQVIDSSVTSGDGGNGGRGGSGGNGGEGRNGGIGGSGGGLSIGGGDGGNGQSGSRGGHGGGGAGGISVGIYCENSQIAPDASATVVAGALGAGGVSAGVDGAAGFRAELYQCQ